MKKTSRARLGIYISLWVLFAATLANLAEESASVQLFWRQFWQFGLFALGVLLINACWVSQRNAVLSLKARQSDRQLAFRERMERELTELSTGFINVPLEEIDEAIRHALERVAVICDVDSCSLWLWDDQHRFIKSAIEWHASSVGDKNRQWQKLDFELLPWLKDHLQRGVPVHVLASDELPVEAEKERQFCEQFGIRAFAMMPIRFDDKVQGTIGLVVYSDRGYWLGPDMAPFLLIADMLSSALQQKKYQQLLVEANSQLQVLSEIDELTGIANRRYFNLHFMNIARQAARTGQVVTLLMIDIDFFKKYNDCYGHLQGDNALVEIARMVDKSFRRADEHAARYGGEEFTVIFAAGSDPLAIYEQAKNLRLKVLGLKIPHSESSVSDYVTVCIGVACIKIVDPAQTAELIQLADECLYKAKSGGRNRVIYRDIDGQLHCDREESSKDIS